MTLQTRAVADDFPHFKAWYGKLPDFEYLRSYDKHHCFDYLFQIRILGDSRYYAGWQYADSDSYGFKAAVSALDDWSECRKISKANMADRPAMKKDWFAKSFEPNSVWEYREPVDGVRRYDGSRER